MYKNAQYGLHMYMDTLFTIRMYINFKHKLCEYLEAMHLFVFIWTGAGRGNQGLYTQETDLTILRGIVMTKINGHQPGRIVHFHIG